MTGFIVRFLMLLERAKNKIFYTLNPQWRIQHLFPNELRNVLNSEFLEVIDVGGAGDLQPHWYKLIGAARFTIFEPHPASYDALVEKYKTYIEKELFKVFPVGLSGSGGKRALFMTNTPTGSSIIRFNEKSPFLHADDGYVFPLREIPIETQTLDQCLSHDPPSSVDLIKLDIQGAELEVLAGLGAKRIGNLLAVEMETHLHDFYADGSKLRDVIQFIDDNDFELLDVRVARDYIQRNGLGNGLKTLLGISRWTPSTSAKAWEFDLVFFKKPNSLLQTRNALSIRKLIACYCVYNFFIEACGLAVEAFQAGIFSSEERDQIQTSVLAMKKCMDIGLRPYTKIVNGMNDQNWGQYMWVRFPTT